MDREMFDGLAKLLAISPSRRAALGALLGAGLAGALGAAAAKKDGKKRKGGARAKGAEVSAEAVDCSSPGHGANISGCPYQNEDFSGQDLSSSRMIATNFRGATLIGTDLSSSNAKNAVFRDAKLCGADLRSSTLGGADFRGADLTLANLKSSSGCGSLLVNAGTTFCGTVMCDGSVRNDDCPAGPEDACCTDADCPPSETCAGGGPGVPNVCGCRDNGAACQGKSCGDTINNCGQTVSCGTCAGGLVCTASRRCAASCTPRPTGPVGADTCDPSNDACCLGLFCGNDGVFDVCTECVRGGGSCVGFGPRSCCSGVCGAFSICQ